MTTPLATNVAANAAANATGVVLFAHGSRDPLWRAPMEAVAARVAQAQPDLPVVCAYLELSTPDLATACQQLVDRGARQIRVLPLFLGVGKHAREDLPLLMDQVRQQHPHTVFTLRSAVGEDPRLLDLLAQLALQPDSD